jgi:pyridoxal phosphate enzyme (YggS family)
MTPSSPGTVSERLDEVRRRIAAACRRAGRSPRDVHVCAVTKTHPAAVVVEAVASGVDAIGENRVQEAATKRPKVAGAVPWHLVGPLQRNKARTALELFDLIETVGREELADRLEVLLAPLARVLPVLVEVNVGGEAQKHGVEPEGLGPLLEHLRRRCPHLEVRGLMTVPPFDPDPERARPHFATLRGLGERSFASGLLAGCELSMGMTDDFEVAVEEGATWVRLGRVLFGERRSA